MEFYTRGGWKGEKYSEVSNLSTTEIAKLIRKEIKKKFPNIKTSVRTRYFANGSSIDVIIKDPGFNPINPDYNPNEWVDNYRNPIYTRRGEKLLKDIEAIGNKYRYSDVDSSIDYFNVSFYLSVDYDNEKRDKWIKQKQRGK